MTTFNIAANVNPFSNSDDKTFGRDLASEAADFLNTFEAPQISIVSPGATKAFVDKFLAPRLKLNVLAQKVELDGVSLSANCSTASLSTESRMSVICENKFQVAFKSQPLFKNHLYDAIRRNSYHPIEIYLNSLESVERVSIDNLAERYFGNKDKLANVLVKKFLIAAVARIFQPGCQVDSILVLFSPKQGIGKSSFLATLAKHRSWFNDTVPSLNQNRDFYLNLHQHWITEIGEIDTKFKGDKEEDLKAFITSREDNFRPAYTREHLNCKRQFILTGTTNNGNFLHDQTGSRRYWIVPVMGDKINIPLLESEVDGIWAAAVDAYRNGEQWHLTDEEDVMLEAANASYTYEHPWYPIIEEYVERHKNDEYILPKDVAAIPALGIPSKEIDKPNSKSIKEIRDMLRQKFHFTPKNKSIQQRTALFNKLTNDPSLRPRVDRLEDIPHSVWVKFDDFFSDDSDTSST